MTAVDLNAGTRYAPADRRRAQWLYADLCLRDKAALIATDHGRRAGWFVYAHDRYVCSLDFYSRPDPVWDTYEVVDADAAHDVANDAFWQDESHLRFANRANPQFELLHAQCRWDAEHRRVLASGLFLPFHVSHGDRLALAVRRLYREVRPTDEE
ncbi:MAG: hypothetical protein KF708_13570 [Pirellulales bacterium]|nr:hypothetical protein [Pirellulales bacterium]